MSKAGLHSDWFNLIETSGPFLARPVLDSVFPQGIEGLDTPDYRALKDSYEEWLGQKADAAAGRKWLLSVLSGFLAYPLGQLAEGQAIPDRFNIRVPQSNATLRPDFVLCDPAETGRGDARMFICRYPAGQSLSTAISGSDWKASPQTRMQEMLLRGPEKERGGERAVELGLITNGEEWMLVHADGRNPASFASWFANVWAQERQYAASFRALLGAKRLFGVAEDETLEALLQKSAEHQQEVTDQLGLQVRQAVEVLVRTFDRIEHAHGERGFFSGVSEKQIYDAALTVMMRLVFLFSAEERGLLPKDEPLFAASYSVSLLRAQLREEADRTSEDVLENRRDAWCRLLAAFRLVYSGSAHPSLLQPAYGGQLFDPDRYPFLEGRAAGSDWRTEPADPLPVDNRTVLHLLCALQELRQKGGKDSKADVHVLSFRALDIEQIGHVYEGLLDHTARRAKEGEIVLGLSGTKGKEPELPLSELQRQRSKGEASFAKWLGEITGKSAPALRKALDNPQHAFGTKLSTALGGSAELELEVAPFLGLVRADSFGYPLIVLPGGLYVTTGSLRRSTGTHYTPRSLTEPIVKHTLDPLIYAGPAEGLPEDEWKLKSPRDILALRVCDMAMGSGAFLVQACRYLSEKLVEAWEDQRRSQPDDRPLSLPFGDPATGETSERLLPAAENLEEKQTLARRLVAERCLFGVDINPMAVEMAKLSLWLITMQRAKPFSFLDHALKCGDSLLGIGLRELKSWSLDGRGKPLEHFIIKQDLEEAVSLRRSLEAIPDETLEAVEHKQRLHREAERRMARLKLGGDLILAPYFGFDKAKEREAEAQRLLGQFMLDKPAQFLKEDLLDEAGDQELRQRAEQLFSYTNNEGEERRHTPFHWELEFPEVFLEGGKRGFDVFVGNPPFIGGQKLTGNFGTAYREYLVHHLAGGIRGSADLVAYFFLRAARMLSEGGGLGLIATNTIAQGDTRQVGLGQLAREGYSIYRANASRKWPGTANLEVAVVWLCNGGWPAQSIIEEGQGFSRVPSITPYLTPPGKVSGDPYRLAANAGKSFIGSYVLGMGFVLSPEEAQALIDKDPRNKDVLFPYLNGEDLNSRPDQSASRWVINFFDWPLKREDIGVWSAMDDKARRKCLQEGIVPLDYREPVAADFPDCLAIVQRDVFPQRQKQNDEYGQRHWWKYLRTRPEFDAAARELENVWVTSRVSARYSVVLCNREAVCNERLVLIAEQSFEWYAMLQSIFHEEWMLRYGSTLETRPLYTPSDCFETYPFCASLSHLKEVGERFYTYRHSIMTQRQEGLTVIYNRFHKPEERSADIVRLRELQVEMDQAVARAYGWGDLDLGHGFHETKQGLRYTISEEARREVLDRLLALNITRYAEEVAQGLHNGDKKLTAEKIDELCERLQALDRPDLIEAARNRPTGKAKSPRGRKASPSDRPLPPETMFDAT